MSEIPLTDRQSELLQWITQYFQKHGRTPTMQEIGDHFSISRPTAFNIVKPLINKGYLRKVGSGPFRRLEIIDETGTILKQQGVPVVGRVAAGLPLLATENRIGWMLVDDVFVRRGATFALVVEGKSMIGADILPGDKVIVRPQKTAEKGQIVIARFDDEVTIKYFHTVKNGMVTLKAANPDHQDIVKPASECSIQGIVVGLCRKYPMK